MNSWQDFLTEADTSSSDVQAIEAFVSAIKDLAKRFNRPTLFHVWDKVRTGKGDELVREIIRNPSKSSSDLRKLVQSK
jgi:hypothetical protein